MAGLCGTHNRPLALTAGLWQREGEEREGSVPFFARAGIRVGRRSAGRATGNRLLEGWVMDVQSMNAVADAVMQLVYWALTCGTAAALGLLVYSGRR